MKHQIIRMATKANHKEQQHYDVTAKTWAFSAERFDGTFESTNEEAKSVHAELVAKYRQNKSTSRPVLHEII